MKSQVIKDLDAREYAVSLSPREVDLIRAALQTLKEDIVVKMKDYEDFRANRDGSSEEYVMEVAHTVAMFEACIKDYHDAGKLLERVMQLTLQV